MKKLLIISAMLISSFAGYSQTDEAPKRKCSALTKEQKPCSRSAVNDEAYCKQHSPNSIRCAGKTKAGKDCQVIPKKGETLCYHHKAK